MTQKSDETRRTVDEIVARYMYEPALRDIFVEGPADARVLEYWFARQGLHCAVAYEIETVEIPSDVVLGLGFEDNNRGRVLALARIIERELGSETRHVTFLVDADFDRLLEAEGVSIPTAALVRRTDYSSMEMYLFCDEVFQKFFSLSCRIRSFGSERFHAKLIAVLRWLFSLRAASRTLNLALTLVALGGKYLSLSRTCVELNTAKYLKVTLESNRIAHSKAHVTAEMERHLSAAVGDDRHFMHGHDFLSVVSWIARKCAKEFKSVPDEAIQAALWSCLEPDLLSVQPLFIDLARWAQQQPGDTSLQQSSILSKASLG